MEYADNDKLFSARIDPIHGDVRQSWDDPFTRILDPPVSGHAWEVREPFNACDNTVHDRPGGMRVFRGYEAIDVFQIFDGPIVEDNPHQPSRAKRSLTS